MYGLPPPPAVKVAVLFTAKVIVAGEIPNDAKTLTAASEILPRASVARTTALPGVAGAV